jgi:dihydroflavonol-4-reductase
MVLVTGGTGFLGAYIIQELILRGHTIRAIRRNQKTPFFINADILEKVEWVTCDVLDITGIENAMEGVDAVIHSAAKVSFHKEERSEMFNTNVEGTTNMVNAAIEKNISRFIHVSSVAAIGRKTNGAVINEDKKWEDSPVNTNYAISKYHAEMEVWRGIAEGLNGVIVNPSTILGYGDWNESSCAIFKNTYLEFPWYTTGINGFVDVQDVAKAIVLLLESNIIRERFILSGDNWSFHKLLTTIAEGFDKKKPYKKATPLLGGLVWRLEKIKTTLTGKKSLLTREAAQMAQSKTYFDNNKILHALSGFSFTPLEQTISHACKNYRAFLQPL